MHWNPLAPEISVSDFHKSLNFYTAGVGFSVLFTRNSPDFAYLDLGGAQIMLEADHCEAWTTGRTEYPRGRGLNLQIEVPDLKSVRGRLQSQGIIAFRELTENWYDTSHGKEGQYEYLVQDPDGYLIRLVEIIATENSL